MMKKTMFAVSVFALCVVACGGDDGGDDFSGVDSSQVIRNMTADQKTEFCVYWAPLQESAYRENNTLCHIVAGDETFEGGGDGTIEYCEAAYASCLQSVDAGEFDDFFAQDNCSDLWFSDYQGADCTATVGQLEQCANDVLNYIEDVSDDLSCSNVEERFLNEVNSPASCKVLDDLCPLPE